MSASDTLPSTIKIQRQVHLFIFTGSFATLNPFVAIAPKNLTACSHNDNYDEGLSLRGQPNFEEYLQVLLSHQIHL